MTSPQTSPTRRDRRKLEMRERIIQAAHSLFQANGYQASTVADICIEADVAYKTFFNHFPSKHQVLLEVEAEGLESVLTHLSDVLESEGSTAKRIAAFFERIAAEAEAAGPMNRELLAEMIHSAHTRGDEPDQIKRIVAAIKRIVEVGIEQGDVRTDVAVDTLADLIRGNYYVLMISFGNLADYAIVNQAKSLASLVAESLAVRDSSPIIKIPQEPHSDA